MRVRDAHFFRRVPADVSEATKSGGIVSIFAWVTIGWLVLTQYSEYATSRHTTQLQLDRTSRTAMIGGGAAIRINFNITMNHLPCHFAQVTVADHVGAHEVGGARNVHKVRIDEEGETIGMYEPHKYTEKASQAEKSLSAHVFPWHKKQHTQGDAAHRKEVAMKHLSADQREVVSKVEDTIHQAGKGTHVGRRLLSVPEPPAQAAQSQPPSSLPPSSLPPSSLPPSLPASPTPSVVAADTQASCPAWAKSGECQANSGYMLTACASSCRSLAATDTGLCPSWASAGRCQDAAAFMAEVCPNACAGGAPAGTGGGSHPEGGADGTLEAHAKGGAYDDQPLNLTPDEFDDFIHNNGLVFVNFYAPWCFWSNKLTPAWSAVGKRLYKRAYSEFVKFVKVDCTTPRGQEVCKAQSIHAFPSVRIYRGSSHAFEPYEYDREENIMWLHLVKTAAEIIVGDLNDSGETEDDEFKVAVSHVSADLKEVMDRRAKGLDEDWSESALAAEDEVREDQDLLDQISNAVTSVAGAKGRVAGATGGTADDQKLALQEHSSDLVLGLLSSRRLSTAVPNRDGADEGELPPFKENDVREGCNLFGYIDVSRAPGTLHIHPHSPRHSFDFSTVNTTHHIDHLSFGLELTARERRKLPAEVVRQLTTLDGYSFIATEVHETQEHHVNIMPTSFGRKGDPSPTETYQFTATSHGRTRDTLPSLLISYDVSPVHAHIVEAGAAFSDFIVSLCAIVGGAVSVFGIVDGLLYASTSAVKKQLGGKSY